MDPIAPIAARHAPAAEPTRGPDAPLRKAAAEFEAVFLAEMFAHTGLGATRKSNGGGAGEEAFASLLAREWAGKVTAAGGIGLSERIYQALATREAGDA